MTNPRQLFETPPDESAELSLELRIDAAETLATAARLRFENRRGFEWRIFFGIWAGLGTSAGLVLTARTFPPNWLFFFLCLVSCVVGYLQLKNKLIPLIQSTHSLDQQQSYYWTSAIEQLANLESPPALRPTPSRAKKWLRFEDSRPQTDDEPSLNSETCSCNRANVEENDWVNIQLSITELFLFLFLLSVGVRCYHASEENRTQKHHASQLDS